MVCQLLLGILIVGDVDVLRFSVSITSGAVPIRTPIFLPFSVLKSEAVMSSRERSA